MTTIQQLNAVDQVSSDDQVPIYKSSEANAMRVPASAFVAVVAGTAIEEMEQIKAETQAIADDLGSFPEAIAEVTALRDQAATSASSASTAAASAAGHEAGAAAQAGIATAAAVASSNAQYNYMVDNAAALAALTGMTSGQRAFQRDNEHVYQYNGSAWVDVGLAPTALKADKSVVDPILPVATLIKSVTDTYGPASLVSGTALNQGFVIVAGSDSGQRVTTAGLLSGFQAYVQTVGSGAITLYLCTRPSDSSTSITFRRRIDLNTSTSAEGSGSAGIKTWSKATLEAAYGGTIDAAVGDYLGWYTPTGGAQVAFLANGGSPDFDAAGSGTTPAQGATATLADNGGILFAKMSVLRTMAQVQNSDLAPSIVADVASGVAAAANTPTVNKLAPLLGPVVYGPTSLYASAGTNYGVALMQKRALPAGPLQGISAYIQATVGTGNLTFVVATLVSGNTFTRRVNIPLTATATGLKSWSQAEIEAAAGGPVSVAAGEYLGVVQAASPNGAYVGYDASVDVDFWYVNGDPASTASWIASTGTSGGTIMVSCTIGNAGPYVQTTQMEPGAQTAIANAGSVPSLLLRDQGRTVLLDTAFGASSDPLWTETGTWTKSSAGWLSPATPTAYTTALQASRNYNLDRRTTRLRFVPQSTGAIVMMGYQGKGNQQNSSCVVDGAANLLRLKRTANAQNITADPTDWGTTPITGLVANREYALEYTRDRRTNTCRLIDLVTGASWSLTQDSSASGHVNVTTGESFGYPFVYPLAGQILVKQHVVWAGYKEGCDYIAGDSITDGWLVTLAQGYAQQLVAGTGGVGAISARPGEISDVMADLQVSEIPFLKPRRIFVYLGTNLNAGVAINQTVFNALVAYCAAQGIQLGVGLVAPIASRTETVGNAYLLSLPASVRKVRFDLALSLNNDGVTYNPANFQDGTHPAPVGDGLMAARARMDYPDMFFA